MRLTEISAQNYLSHRGLNIVIAPETRVLVISGPNGAGKTAISQAIKLCLTGEPTRGLQYKKDLVELITQGERDGMVYVTYEDGGSEFEHSLNLRTAACSAPGFDYRPVSLDPAEFFAMDAPTRRKLLFAAAGLKLSTETIRETLVSKGHDPDRVARAVQYLRLGFDAAATEAKTAATEARGAWKQITGETYGEVKAVGWKAYAAKIEDKTPVDKLQKLVEEASIEVNEKTVTLSGLRADETTLKRAEKAIKAKGALTANTKAANELEAQRAALQLEVDKLSQTAQHSGGETAPCPACGTVLFWNAKGELKEWEKAKPAQSPIEAHKVLAEKRAELKRILDGLDIAKDAVADGKAAQTLLDNLPKIPSAEAIKKAENDLAAANATLSLARADLESRQRGLDEQAKAAAKTESAAQEHANVIGYSSLADALTNLPAEYLTKTLSEVNSLCNAVSHAFDKAVVVGDDMEVRYGTIAYPLASTSQQWRMRMAIGYALAVMSGLELLVLDDFDCVEPAARGAILQWLSSLVDVQTVLCATLKARPNLPAPFQVHWMGE